MRMPCSCRACSASRPTWLRCARGGSRRHPCVSGSRGSSTMILSRRSNRQPRPVERGRTPCLSRAGPACGKAMPWASRTCEGLILNRVPGGAAEYVGEYARPYLEENGIHVLGSMPSVPRLSALSVGELLDLLDAQVLTKYVDPNALVEAFSVGAMTADVALSRFRRQTNKAVITGGDRTDIQLAALETSTVVLILTGNLHPSPLIIQQAESLNVPILLVKDNTMETTERIDRAYGKTRLGQPEKLETFIQLLAANVDIKAIYAAINLV